MKVVTKYEFEKLKQIDDGQGKNSLGVWLANDPQLGGDVAVKEIARSTFRDPDEFFDEAKRMFASEHPNVVPIRLGSQSADNVYLVMKYFQNGSLASKIEQSPLSVQAVRRIGREVLAGIGSIHAGGSIHLDVKPSNILIGDRGESLVADLGQARTLGPLGFTPMANRMYIPHLPPECFAGGVAGVQADIYQVGLTLYRCLNGNADYETKLNAFASIPDFQSAVESGSFPRRDDYLPHVARSLRMVINRAIHPDLSKRYQTAFDFANALAQLSLKHDWHPTTSVSGEIEWRTKRPKKHDLIARLNRDPAHPSRWKVDWYTRNGAGKECKTLATMRTENVTLRQAMQHLRQSFQTLERV